MLVDLEKKKIQFLSDANINKVIVVCSHERSGTHFLMNSIALNSHYSVEPFVDFDYMNLGDVINFHKSDHVSNFIKKIAFIKKKDTRYGLSSLIKSHHPAYIFKNLFNSDDVIFYYIYRNPIDTLISYWKFINHWDWHEGPKETNLIKFVKSPPEGQMQRYQKKSYHNIFARWANHVSEWVECSSKFKNIYLVKYENLNNEFEETMKNVLKSIETHNVKINRPPKENFVMTNQLKISDNEIKEYKDFIKICLLDYPSLKEVLEI